VVLGIYRLSLTLRQQYDRFALTQRRGEKSPVEFCKRKPRHLYLILCLLGIVLPYSQLVPWLLEHGLNVELFFRELFANRISAFFTMDVIVSAIVLICFIQSEGNRL
jgi:hypothetical protein